MLFQSQFCRGQSLLVQAFSNALPANGGKPWSVSHAAVVGGHTAWDGSSCRTCVESEWRACARSLGDMATASAFATTTPPMTGHSPLGAGGLPSAGAGDVRQSTSGEEDQPAAASISARSREAAPTLWVRLVRAERGTQPPNTSWRRPHVDESLEEASAFSPSPCAWRGLQKHDPSDVRATPSHSGIIGILLV